MIKNFVLALLLLLISLCVLVFDQEDKLAVNAQSYEDVAWRKYHQVLFSSAKNQFCARNANFCRDMRDMVDQVCTQEYRGADFHQFLKYVPAYDEFKYEPKCNGHDCSFESVYEKILLSLPSNVGENAYKDFHKRQYKGSFVQLGETIRQFTNRARSLPMKKILEMDEVAPVTSSGKSFILSWKDGASERVEGFDRYRLRLDAAGISGIKVKPGKWFDRNLLRTRKNFLLSKNLIGRNGRLPLIPSVVWVMNRPRVHLSVSRTAYYTMWSKVYNENINAFSVGSMKFQNPHIVTGGTLSYEEQVFSDLKMGRHKGSSMKFVSQGTPPKGDNMLSDSSEHVLKSIGISTSNVKTTQGAGAIQYFSQDIDSDGKADIVQLWNYKGELCILFYKSTRGYESQNICTGQGYQAVAFLSGDYNGDGKIDIIQLWSDRGTLNILFYDAARNFKNHNKRTRQGSGALQYFTGDVDGDGKADILHLWSNHGKLCIVSYKSTRGYEDENICTNQGYQAVAWLAGDYNGDGKTDIMQLWSDRGTLNILFYDAARNFENHNKRTRQGSGALQYLTGDVDGDGKADIIHLWSNHGKLCILYYASTRGYEELNRCTVHGPKAVKWLAGDFYGDRRTDIAQLWDCDGKLSINIFNAATGFLYTTVHTPQGIKAVSYMTGDLSGQKKQDIFHLWRCENTLCIMSHNIVHEPDKFVVEMSSGATGIVGVTSGRIPEALHSQTQKILSENVQNE